MSYIIATSFQTIYYYFMRFIVIAFALLILSSTVISTGKNSSHHWEPSFTQEVSMGEVWQFGGYFFEEEYYA